MSDRPEKPLAASLGAVQDRSVTHPKIAPEAVFWYDWGMFTANQEKYLKNLSPEKANRIIHIYPFNPELKKIAHQLIAEIQRNLPEAKIFSLGSGALEISGMNDIDISVVSSGSFDDDKKTLSSFYGLPTDSHGRRYALWEFERNNYPVELSLNNDMARPLQEQIDTCEILKQNPDLLKEYEQIKLDSEGVPFREYMRRKYEFFNKVLGEV